MFLMRICESGRILQCFCQRVNFPRFVHHRKLRFANKLSHGRNRLTPEKWLMIGVFRYRFAISCTNSTAFPLQDPRVSTSMTIFSFLARTPFYYLVEFYPCSRASKLVGNGEIMNCNANVI